MIRLVLTFLASLAGGFWIPLLAREAHASWSSGAIFTMAWTALWVSGIVLVDLMSLRPHTTASHRNEGSPLSFVDRESIRLMEDSSDGYVTLPGLHTLSHSVERDKPNQYETALPNETLAPGPTNTTRNAHERFVLGLAVAAVLVVLAIGAVLRASHSSDGDGYPAVDAAWDQVADKLSYHSQQLTDAHDSGNFAEMAVASQAMQSDCRDAAQLQQFEPPGRQPNKTELGVKVMCAALPPLP
jgi:hypothetical protein